MIVDCDTCTVRGAACGDCVVTVLLGPPATFGEEERRALGVLADSGLVPPLRLVAPLPETAPSTASGGPDGRDVNNDTPGRSRRAV